MASPQAAHPSRPPSGNSRPLRCGSFPIRTRFAGLRTGPLFPPSRHPSPLNDQAQGDGDPNGAQRSGSIWERRSKGAHRIFAARRKWRGADFATTSSAGGPSFSLGQGPLSLELPALLDRQLIAAVVVRVLRVARVAAKSAPLSPA